MPDAIPDRTPTLAELHRKWMHARLKREQAERAKDAAYAATIEAERLEALAVAPLAEALLADTTKQGKDRQRHRMVAIAGEVLNVSDGGQEWPGEYRITPVPVELVPLD